MIALIDYDAGNMKSVEKALQLIGEDVLVTRDPKEILAADKVVLPGVGSFGDAMENLHHFGLVPVIHQVVQEQWKRSWTADWKSAFLLKASRRKCHHRRWF